MHLSYQNLQTKRSTKRFDARLAKNPMSRVKLFLKTMLFIMIDEEILTLDIQRVDQNKDCRDIRIVGKSAAVSVWQHGL